MYLEELKSSVVSAGKLPEHVAIIMDGNGRWARKRGLTRTMGHRAGVKTVKKIVRIAGDIGLRYLTLFTFSTENWKRPRTEVSAIMRLLEQTTKKELSELLENNVKLIATGNIENLPPRKRDVLLDAIERTKHNTGLVLNLALSYSGRAEILQAIKHIAADISKGKINPENIDGELFSSYLQTNGLPDPDFLIRTSGEMRISNFLLWQTAYTELYVTDVLWPDFTEDDFLRAIADYQRRDRRFGMVPSSG